MTHTKLASKSATSPIVFQFLTEVGIIAQLSNTALERILPKKLSVAGFGMLNRFILVKPDGDSPANMAQAFQVTRGAITNTISRLEEQGFVTILPDPKDGRAKIVCITEAGRQCHANCLKALRPFIAEVGRDIGIDALAQCLPTLASVRLWMDRDREN